MGMSAVKPIPALQSIKRVCKMIDEDKRVLVESKLLSPRAPKQLLSLNDKGKYLREMKKERVKNNSVPLPELFMF